MLRPCETHCRQSCVAHRSDSDLCPLEDRLSVFNKTYDVLIFEYAFNDVFQRDLLRNQYTGLYFDPPCSI